FTQNYLKFFSHHSHPHTSTQPNAPHPSPISNPSIFARPYPLAFPYIPESFSQCLFVIHPFPQLRINFINIFITLH
ncbi:hypothetical protein, partial [Klebsiella pneumoniae]|uniref:hypothetical protein n=1 Tax=Klebsiella pneumoniae TaxID=573 RepID=UPI001C3D2BAD